jgi:hypothetical protein
VVLCQIETKQVLSEKALLLDEGWVIVALLEKEGLLKKRKNKQVM